MVSLLERVFREEPPVGAFLSAEELGSSVFVDDGHDFVGDHV